MATKTISLDEDAYNRLKNEKEDDESFSDTVKRITGERSLTEIAGIWSDDNELREIVKENRKRSEKELRERAEELKE
ncbi:MAG: antitoxin VapB family protein [Candidatus Nanohaloarchaea archaeon]